MKNKTVFLLLPLCIFGLVLIGCTGASQDYVAVQVAMEKPGSFDINRADRVFFEGFDIREPESAPGIDIDSIVSDYFLVNFSSLLNKEIDTEIPASPPDSAAAVGGELSLKILERNVIQKVGDPGRKTRQFVKVENWTLELTIRIVDPATRDVLFEKTYRRSLEEADPEDPYFNFKTVFNYCADLFSREVIGGEKIERRFLLLGR